MQHLRQSCTQPTIYMYMYSNSLISASRKKLLRCLNLAVNKKRLGKIMSGRPKVFLTQDIPRDSDGYKLLQETCEMTMYDETKTGAMFMKPDELMESAKGFDALYIVAPVRIDGRVLDAIGPQLKVVSSQSVGLDHIDVAECYKRGIKVGYTPGVLSDAVAEAAIGLTIATARRHQDGRRDLLNGVWGTKWENSLYLCGKDLKNSTIGIIGLGRIGLEVAKRLVAFRVSKILYTSRSPKDHASEVSAEYVSFNKLLEESDFIIACCSVNASNQKLINADAFKKMKKSAILINMSRGALIDQEALYEALKSGEILAAGLDVTTPEPLPTDHPLLSLSNCTILPHMGSSSVATRHDMVNLCVRNILAGLKGEPLSTPAPV